MKNTVLLFIMLFSTSTIVTAQTPGEKYDDVMAKYPVRFGIKAGLNAANITVDNEGTLNDKKAIPAWHAGIYVDIPLLPVLSLQPGVFLNSKGARFTIGNNESSNYTEVSMRPLYLEVPVNLVIKIPLPGKVNLIAGAGPYAAMGIAGKNRTEGKLAGISFSDKDNITYSNDDPGTNGSAYNGDLKRFDFGLNFIAGLEISRFTLNAAYGYGLVNIKPGSANDDAKYQNRVFSLSVGLLF